MNTKPRMPRAENDTRTDWQKRLDAAVNGPSVEKSCSPDVRLSVEPDKKLGESWLSGLEFGGEE